jgi:hypothetical protein
MMPTNLDPRGAARRKRALAAGFIGGIAAAVDAVLGGTRFHSWAWTSWLAGLVIITAVALTGYRGRSDGRPKAHGGHRVSRPEADDGPATHGWPMLALVSRLMPRSAGARWLAEAESTLAEIADDPRGAAFRSYLLSAPRLIPALWLHQIASLRRRRPG